MVSGKTTNSNSSGTQGRAGLSCSQTTAITAWMHKCSCWLVQPKSLWRLLVLVAGMKREQANGAIRTDANTNAGSK